MAGLPESLQRSLKATATLSIAELYSEGQASATDAEEWPLAQISEILDARTCPLCAWLDGKILKVGSAEYARYRGPSHINCRRILVAIHKDERGVEVDFTEPDGELLRKHGHYHLDPDKHAAYRIPAEPVGRHVIVRRVKHLDTGEIGTQLDWAPWYDQTPKWKRELAFQARATQDPAELAGILEQLGLTDLEDAAQLRAAHLLGLQDRLQGWVTTSIAQPPDVAAVIRQVEAEIAVLKSHEVAVAFDSQGKEFFRKKGGKDYVAFTDAEAASFQDATLTHNHPSGSAFSIADWQITVGQNMQEMRATGINDQGEHHTYILTRPTTGWGRTAQEVVNVLNQIQADLFTELWPRVNNGELTPAEASWLHSQELNTRASAALGYDYRRIRIN